MTATIRIAPVRKSIRVNASQAHAFEVFTSGLGSWWPLEHGIGKTPRKAAIIQATGVSGSCRCTVMSPYSAKRSPRCTISHAMTPKASAHTACTRRCRSRCSRAGK